MTLHAIPLEEACRIKYESGARKYGRPPGGAFRGDPLEECYAEMVDARNYLAEANARGERVAADWHRRITELAGEMQTHLLRTRRPDDQSGASPDRCEVARHPRH